MALAREPIYAALAAALKARCPDFVRVERKFLDFSQVPAGDQPALMVVEGDQNGSHQSASLPTMWKLDAVLVVYVRTTDSATPGTALLGILDALEAAFERQPGEVSPFTTAEDQKFTTLGGKVRRAWIAGNVQINPGAEGEQGIAIVPVEMLALA